MSDAAAVRESLRQDRDGMLREMEELLGSERYRRFRDIGGIGLFNDVMACPGDARQVGTEGGGAWGGSLGTEAVTQPGAVQSRRQQPSSRELWRCGQRSTMRSFPLRRDCTRGQCPQATTRGKAFKWDIQPRRE